ncbi:MAG: FAD:protein FMN transferase [Gemmatimonadales bacterium]
MDRLLPVLAGLLLLACDGKGAGGGPVWIDRKATAMEATLQMSLEAPSRMAAVEASQAVLSAVGASDALLSPNRTDSRVSELNATAVGATAEIDPSLCQVLREVDRSAAEVPGVFDLVIGSLVDAWDLDGDGRVPSVVELEAARRAAGNGGMQLDLDRCVAQRLAAAAGFMPWGFVKGYSLRAVRDSLRAHGVHSAQVTFGQQVVVLGPTRTGGPWRLAIPSPEDNKEEVFTLWLAGGSASTSSQSGRYVRAAGQTIGHILDPRTGTPVPGWGSLTVVAADPLRADVLSTALFVLGPDSAYAWAEGHNDVGVLILDRRDGAIRFRYNEGLRPALDSATATPIR